MQKLTREQAEGLIKSLNNNGLWNTETDSYISMLNLKQVINQCTEKEFPEFKVENCGNLIEATLNAASNKHVCIEITDCRHPSASESIGLTFKQFKEFANGCNKIVEWIKENE